MIRQITIVLFSVISAILVPIGMPVYAQCNTPQRSLVRLFDRLDLSYYDGQGLTWDNDEGGNLSNGESYIMHSYLLMYEATSNPYYLQKIAEHAEAVLAHRDDLRDPPVSDYTGVSSARWRSRRTTEWDLCNCCKWDEACKCYAYCTGTACVDQVPYCYVYGTGMLTYPMARFAAIVLADPQLQSVQCDWPSCDGETLGEKALLFIDRVEESIEAHEFQWHQNTPIGWYEIPEGAPVICGAPDVDSMKLRILP